MARLSMVEAINRTFHELMEKDDRIVVMGEDVGVDGGVFRATVGLLEKFGDDPCDRHSAGRELYRWSGNGNGNIWDAPCC